MSFKKLVDLPTIQDHFWERVNKNGPKQPHMKTRCWLWLGKLSHAGYPRMTCVIDGHRYVYAHQVALSFALGRNLYEGMQAQHLCNNPACVNFEDHLVEGTHLDNMSYRNICQRTCKGEKHWTKTHPEKLIRGKAASVKTLKALKAHPEAAIRGENTKSAKLNNQAVLNIRNLYSTGKYSQQKLANMYSVNQFTIWAVVNNRTWKHLL